MWLILAAVLLSAGNAIVRKAFDIGSNALLEIQWYLFAAVFMLGAGYAFLKNSHVRIDFISNHLSPRTRNIIDIVGILVFLFPLCYLITTMSWPTVHNAWVSGEMSQNAGGLIRWPVYLLIPVGFCAARLAGPVGNRSSASPSSPAPVPMSSATSRPSPRTISGTKSKNTPPTPTRKCAKWNS